MTRSIRTAPTCTSLLLNAIALLVLLTGPIAARAADSPTLTRVRFQLSVECTCASCCFELQDRLHNAPGVNRVDIAARDKTVVIAFDESRVPVGQIATTVNSTVLGKNSSLVGLLAQDEKPSASELANALPAIKSADVDTRKGRLLVRLVAGSHVTTADLEAALTQKNVSVHFNTIDKK